MHDKLYWLQAGERFDLKLCLLAYKAVHGLAPDYIAEMCPPVGSVDAGLRLCSSTAGNLIVPASNTQFGQRAFSVAAIKAWYNLLINIWSSSSVNAFKKSSQNSSIY